MTRREEPLPLRDALAAVGKQLGLPAPAGLETLAARWPDIVGPAAAEHARVGSVRDGVCTILVDSPAWATQLRYRATDLAARVAQCCGPGSVHTVRVVVERARGAR